MKVNKAKLKMYLLLIITFCILVILIILGLKSYNNSPADKGNVETVYFKVEEGSDVLTVSEELQEEGLIRKSEVMYDLFVSNDGTVYANTYEISPSMTPVQIYKIISSPTTNITDVNKLLIYEGEEITEIAASLAQLLGISTNEVLDYWANTDNLNQWIKDYEVLEDDILDKNIKYPLEGYLYPATYTILEDDTLESITADILEQTNNKYVDYYDQKNKQGLNFHDSLTLASIVERETMTKEDKYKVAGVFYNRMNQGMKLQSDITVLYALGEHKTNVTYEDLEVDSPYNTYLYNTLPPGPISSVSLDALDAVYNPDDNDYLYFFAKQDTGEVLYSKTLEEHEEISEEYAWE